MKRRRVAVFEKLAAKVRNVDALRATVENKVSTVMSEAFRSQLNTFADQTSKAMAGKGVMYATGGAALHDFVTSNRLVKRVTDLANVNEQLGEILRPLLSTRDIDMCVVPAPDFPVDCHTLRECMKTDVVKLIAVKLKDLGRELNNVFIDNFSEINEALMRIAAEIDGVHAIEVVNSQNIHIEEENGKPTLFERGMPGRKACTAASMKSMLCWPLRDSFNMTISFEEDLSYQGVNLHLAADFVLIRMALMVRVRFEDKRKPRFVPVNFLDVSVLRSGDRGTMMYDKYARSVKVGAEHLPLPPLGVVAENTLRQLAVHSHVAMTGENDTIKANAIQTVKKLENRLKAIQILAYITHGSRSRYSVDKELPPWIVRLVQEMFSMDDQQEALINMFVSMHAKLPRTDDDSGSSRASRPPAVLLKPLSAAKSVGVGASKRLSLGASGAIVGSRKPLSAAKSVGASKSLSPAASIRSDATVLLKPLSAAKSVGVGASKRLSLGASGAIVGSRKPLSAAKSVGASKSLSPAASIRSDATKNVVQKSASRKQSMKRSSSSAKAVSSESAQVVRQRGWVAPPYLPKAKLVSPAQVVRVRPRENAGLTPGDKAALSTLIRQYSTAKQNRAEPAHNPYFGAQPGWVPVAAGG